MTTMEQEKKQVTTSTTEQSKDLGLMMMTQQEKKQVTATTTEQSKELGWTGGKSSGSCQRG